MTLDKETIAKVLHANYDAAAKLLAKAAQDMADAAAAAARGEINLAVGTTMGAEADTKKALLLTEAASTIRQAGQA